MPMRMGDTLSMDQLYERRRNIQVLAENVGLGNECWSRMGVAHRHLRRIEDLELKLVPGVEREILKCFDEVERWVKEQRRYKDAS